MLVADLLSGFFGRRYQTKVKIVGRASIRERGKTEKARSKATKNPTPTPSKEYTQRTGIDTNGVNQREEWVNARSL